MKAGKSSLAQTFDRPDANIRFYLFYGPDDDGSRALAKRLIAGLDAERIVISGSQLKNDPALLATEAAAISLFGGRRAIWIEPASEESVTACEALLQAEAVESPVIAIAGPLRKTSALLKLAESSQIAITHASYPLGDRDLEQLAIELGQAQGLRMDSVIARRIAASSGANQAILAREVEKYALYLGADPSTPRELTPDVVDRLGLDSEGNSAQLADLALDGDLRRLCDTLEALPASAEPIPAVRAVQRRVLQIAPLRARIDGGEKLDAVLTSLGKSLFWKDKPIFQRLLSRWTSARLSQLVTRLNRLERGLMLSASPDHASLGEELIAIAYAARRS